MSVYKLGMNISKKDLRDLIHRGQITSGIPLSRLEEIAQAERDGRCVVLQVKVGDTVYKLGRCSCWCSYPNLSHKKINGTRKCERYTPLYTSVRGKQVCGIVTETAMQENYFPLIGKTVFLSYEAAQAALKEADRE